MSADLFQVEKFLKHWVNTESSPHFAVLLKGSWGCGKTHFVKSTLEAKKFTKRRLVYVSLFGIPDTATLESQLFYASASKGAKLAHQGARAFGSVVKGVIRVDLDGDGKPDGTGNLKFEGLSGMIQKAFKKLDGAVLVIDDIERSTISMTELLGVVNRLVEHGDTRVILVANTDKIQDGEFNSFLEKVVGQSFSISGNASATLDKYISDLPGGQVKDIFRSRREALLALQRKSGYGNLRALKQFLWFLSELIGKLDAKYLENTRLLDHLLEQAFVFFVEFKLCLPGPSEKLAPTDLRSKYDSVGSGSRHVPDFSNLSPLEDEKTVSPKATALNKYKISDLHRTVLTVDQWVSILESGVVDKDWLNKDVAGSEEVAGTDGWPSWKRLWHFYKWDFSDGSEDQFFKDVEDLRLALDSGRYHHPKEFLIAASVFIMIIHYDLGKTPENGVKAHLEKYVEEYLVSTMTCEMYKSFSHDFDTGYEGLSLVFEDKSEVKELLKFTKQKLEEWHDSWLAGGQAGQELLAMLPSQWLSFLGNLTVINDAGEQRFLEHPILQTIPANQFVDAWLSLDIDQERMLTRYMKDRYSRKSDLLVQEGPWWGDVCDELLKKSKTASKPRSVQINNLIESINYSILKK